MPTSVKRYGLEAQDLETELRLRRIEGELERLAGASSYGDVSTQTQRVDTIPRCTGLRVVGSTPGAVTVAWNQVRISNLRRYELEIAEDFAFSTNKQQFNVAGTEWQFSTISNTGGGGDTAVYARVRAQNRSGATGQWSVVLNTTTGQAQVKDIADDAVTDPKLDESAVIQLALRGYKSGFRLSNNVAEPADDLDISAGVARDAANSMSIQTTSVLTKRIDEAWASGTDAGGMSAAGGLAADTWYWVFMVSNGTSSVVDAGFDDSLTATNLLADSGLSYYRRVGAVKTNGASEITQFVQYGNAFLWITAVQDINLNAPGTNEVTHTLTSVPSGVRVFADVTFSFTEQDGESDLVYLTYGGGDQTLPPPTTDLQDGFNNRGQMSNDFHDKVLTNTSAQVKTRQSKGTADWRVKIQVHGWVDTLGRDGEA